MAITSHVNLDGLAALLRTKRGNRGLRSVATEIGNVSASTLSRIEQGNIPDLDTYVRVCNWLGVSPDQFVTGGKVKKDRLGLNADAELDVPDAIEAHLRADRTLPPATVHALTEMIRVAFKAAREDKSNSKK